MITDRTARNSPDKGKERGGAAQPGGAGSLPAGQCEGHSEPAGWKDGGAEGVRTPDLLNAIQALYQLSYDPIRSEGKCMSAPEIVKAILRFELPGADFSLRA